MKPVYSPINYNLYFDTSSYKNTELKFLELGKLNLPTGKIVACDPLVSLGEWLAFTKIVDPGIYPVIACIANSGDFEGRYAAVKLQFKNTVPAGKQAADRTGLSFTTSSKV